MSYIMNIGDKRTCTCSIFNEPWPDRSVVSPELFSMIFSRIYSHFSPVDKYLQYWNGWNVKMKCKGPDHVRVESLICCQEVGEFCLH